MAHRKTKIEFHANAKLMKHYKTVVIAVIEGNVVIKSPLVTKSSLVTKGPLVTKGQNTACLENILLNTKETEPLRLFLKHRITLGQWSGLNCEVWNLESDAKAEHGFELIDLRSLLITLPDTAFSMVSRAVQLIEWQAAYQFCSRCAAPLIQRSNEHAMRCNHCDADYYPRISPCIIVIVTHKDKCLLARQAKWPSGRFSAIAGFIEAGESAEQAVFREVYEEVGIEVEDICYFGSQSWPFPGQLMLGYKAKARSTDIIVDGEEISEAKWWHYKKLPEYVPPNTIMAGRLIQSFIDETDKQVSQH